MPWQLLHKCNHLQPEPGHYFTVKVDGPNGEKMTQLLCGKCRETFYIYGHEWFESAQPLQSQAGFVAKPS